MQTRFVDGSSVCYRVQDQYFQYVFEQAEKLDQKVLLENRSKFLLVHSSSGFKHSLTEVMQEPAVTSKLQDTKALAEVKSLQDFFQMLQTDPDRAYYGLVTLRVVPFYLIALRSEMVVIILSANFKIMIILSCVMKQM